MIRPTLLFLLASVLCSIIGCADDERPIKASAGMETDLPERVEIAFHKQFPGASIESWDQVTTTYNRPAYRIRYRTEWGHEREMWMSSSGEVVAKVEAREPRLPTTVPTAPPAEPR